MGCQTRVVKSVWVYKVCFSDIKVFIELFVQVDPSRNLIYVKGQVPGHKGNYVFLTDAIFKARKQSLPFPTHIGSAIFKITHSSICV